MAEKLQQQLKELGSKLESPPASEDALVELLKLGQKQGVACLSELDQSPPKSMLESMQPFLNAIAKPELLKHQDQEVKLFVAACICEITRITAPEPPYDDNILKDSFQLTVSTLNGLSDTSAPSFGRRVVILETLARYRSCVVMLDLECDDLINEMFTTLFAVARDEHSEDVLTSMQTIMEVVLEESEDVQENLLLTLLSVLGRDKEDVTMAAKRLAMNVIEHNAGKLEPGIKQYLVSSLSGDSRSLNSEINYHAVIYNIYRCAPQILSGVIPYITGELLSEQLGIRLKSVGLVGDLFALPGSSISETFQPVFSEFMLRLTDRVVEVRMAVLEHMKTCLLVNPSRAEAPQIISALCDRLLDCDENVRKQVVSVVCDVACHAPTSIQVETIKLVSERLRDKSILVKRYTMERLADIHRISCASRTGDLTENDAYDWIVGKILRCFYDKDFRSDTIEPIFSLSLFPYDFSVKYKVTAWVRIFAGLDKVEVKALEKILEQKQRLQQEMQKYVCLRQLPEEGDGAETQKKVLLYFRVMSRCFTDHAEVEEKFKILDQLKDSNLWEHLKQLLDPNTSSLQAISTREELLNSLGREHRLYDFLSSLSLKCSYILFDKDHVKEILLEAGVHKSSGNNELILSCMTILVILARFCPLLLGGIEEDLVHLLEDENEIIKEGTLHILAKAGGTIREQLGVSSRSLDLILERICIEGNRRQAKYAVHALVSITKDDGLMSLSVLYKRLVDMLEEKAHLPSVLQSLGCIAQAAMPVFETRESEIEKFIKENILEHGCITGDTALDCWDDRSELCSLKISGIKALVKSYLPVKDAHLRSGIDGLIEILKNILSFGDVSREIKSSLVDKAHLKLTAAKSVLRLSKHWEHKISIDVFYLTLGTSEDNFPDVKRIILNKIHQYVKDRTLDPKYACAFLLDISSQKSYLEENKRNLNDIIQMCRQARGRQYSSQADPNSLPLNPENMLPYVVHSLACHPSFPNIDECKDAKAYEAMYRYLFWSKWQLYLFLSMLVYEEADSKPNVSITNDKETVSLLNSIFLCIKRSEDAFDAAKSKNSYALCDFGLSIVKRLAPKQDDPQVSSPSVILPSALYKPIQKKEDNELLIGEEKTWLADDAVLAHFESLELEANGIIQVDSALVDDDIMKDSETEGNEVPLAKLMKRLKAKAATARKEVKNESAPAGAANENEFDILKMVKEINSDDPGTAGKPGSSNGPKYVYKKEKSSDKLEKRKSWFSKAMDIPVPKRRRTATTKGSNRPATIHQENLDVGTEKMDEDRPSSSEKQPKKEKVAESAESDLLVSRGGKKSSSSSKQKGKRSDKDHTSVLKSSSSAKKSKKVTEINSPRSTSSSKTVSMKKQKQRTALSKCTTKENGSSTSVLIGRRIKVWWPLDKEFYEGVVKSFDSEKKKHAIQYDDGDVEVLSLEKEKWELADIVIKSERSGSSKDFRAKGGSSGQKRKSTGGSEQDEEPEVKIPSAKVRGTRTPRKSLNKKQKGVSKGKSTVKSRESQGAEHPELTTKSKLNHSHSDKEHNEKIKKSLSDEISIKDKKQGGENVDKGSPEAEVPKEEESDSENTESDDVGGASRDARKSHNEAISSSDKMQLDETNEASEEAADEAQDIDSQPSSPEKPNMKASASVYDDIELSDDELLHVDATCGKEMKWWAKLLDLDDYGASAACEISVRS
ncbi:hypothetical protein CASFOL_028632 [Castilleja foliolosa]|uniref:Uncharacterized protein n=1 Tax=Castilleja foliolosa TaxID=1961234 RepID=A0ABD3CCI8_9LAMI